MPDSKNLYVEYYSKEYTPRNKSKPLPNSKAQTYYLPREAVGTRKVSEIIVGSDLSNVLDSKDSVPPNGIEPPKDYQGPFGSTGTVNPSIRPLEHPYIRDTGNVASLVQNRK